MVRKYKKRPVVIEAFQWTGDGNQLEDPGWVIEAIKNGTILLGNKGKEDIGMRIKTLEGIMAASRGDYIIKGIRNELYTCKPDVFDNTYDEYVENEEFVFSYEPCSKYLYEIDDFVIFDNDLTGNENCQGLICGIANPINEMPTYIIEYYDGINLKRKAGVFIEGLIKGLDENN